MKVCLVIDLTMGSNWAVMRPPMFATRYDSLLLSFIPGTKYRIVLKNWDRIK